MNGKSHSPVTVLTKPERSPYATASELPMKPLNSYAYEHGRMQQAISNVLNAWDTGRGLYPAMRNLRDLHDEITGKKKPAEPAGEYRVK